MPSLNSPQEKKNNTRIFLISKNVFFVSHLQFNYVFLISDDSFTAVKYFSSYNFLLQFFMP